MIRSLSAILFGLLLVSAVAAQRPIHDEHTHDRAGGSDRIAPWARPARSDRYAGDYVGGSLQFKGEGRDSLQDGTWGWDYVGRWFRPRRVFLGWAHDRERQPLPGPYRTDGRPFRDVLATPPGPEKTWKKE